MTPVEGCTHRVQHVHGHHRGYACGCRCDDCRRANRRWCKARRYADCRVMIPAEQVHAHVRNLQAAGMTLNEIEVACGHSIGQVLESRHMQRRVAKRVLSVKLGVTTVGIQRRLRALAAVGWTQDQIGARLGVTAQNVSQMVTDRPRECHSAKVERRVVAAYADMWQGPETPSPRAMLMARKKGWVSALAWDDDTIDDARVKPTGLVLSEAVTFANTLENLLEMAGASRSWSEACNRLGKSPATLERQLSRHGYLDEVRAAFRREVAA